MSFCTYISYRQKMKSVLTAKVLKKQTSEPISDFPKKHERSPLNSQKRDGPVEQKVEHSQNAPDSNPNNLITLENEGTSRKRPGRPPKAGCSKKRKIVQKVDFYMGKLSNVVYFKRRYNY